MSSTAPYVLGLNAVPDGLHVVHPTAGFEPLGVDICEPPKDGGSVERRTSEVHP